MLKIAVVEDDKTYALTLQGFLKQYGQERGIEVCTSWFQNAVTFLDPYRPRYDIVLMDIDMPYMNGMEAAGKLRKLDSEICLIFVTSLAQYAVKGYEVDAMDFVVKPVSYQIMERKLDRAMKVLAVKKHGDIILEVERGVKRISANDIYYVEVVKHRLLYHTAEGIWGGWGSISGVEERLKEFHFARCNVCYLVNLFHTTAIENEYVVVAGDRLKISRQKKKEFVHTFMLFLGGRPEVK